MPEGQIFGHSMKRYPLLNLSILVLLALSIWLFLDFHVFYLRGLDVIGGRSLSPGDFYHPWYGSRELLLHHRNPYGKDVGSEIRESYKAEFARLGQEMPSRWGEFAYPVYSAFVLAPLALLPFHVARVLFAIVLILTTSLSVICWLKAMRWTLRPATVILIVLAVFASPPFLQGLMLQQVGLLVAALIAMAMAALVSGYLILAGGLIAVATIKPQMVVLLLPWLVVWSIVRWRARRRFVYGLAGSLAALFILSELVLPGWLPQWTATIESYRSYAGGSILDFFLSPLLAKFLATILIVWWATWFIRLRDARADTAGFAFGLSTTIAVQAVIAPLGAGYNAILLLPVILFIGKELSQRKRTAKTSTDDRAAPH